MMHNINFLKFCFVGILCLSASFTYAYLPQVVIQESLHDITTIQNPEEERIFYGQLIGFPHTYEIQTKTPLNLFVEIRVPDIDSSTNNISGLIVQQVEGSGRVKEVARLNAKEATWESQYEYRGGDRYRHGPQFEQEISPGVYRVEVHTQYNIEKYVLTIGKRENSSDVGYFEMLSRIASVKVFFEKSKFLIIQSPFVYVPLLMLTLLIGIIMWYRRKKRKI